MFRNTIGSFKVFDGKQDPLPPSHKRVIVKIMFMEKVY